MDATTVGLAILTLWNVANLIVVGLLVYVLITEVL